MIEWKRKGSIVMAAFFTALAAVMEHSPASVYGKGLEGIILFVLLVIIWNKCYEYIKKEATFLLRVLSMLLAFFMVLGLSLYKDNSFSLLYSGSAQVLKTVVLLFGYYSFYMLVSMAGYWGLNASDRKCLQFGKKIFDKNSFRKVFGIISCIWLPQIALRYPGGMCYDSYAQLYQYKGLKAFTSHHPPFHTWLFGTVVRIGERLGSMELGQFIFVLLQTFFLIAALAYSIQILERMEVPYLYRTIMLVIYCVVPYYVGYAGIVIKDTLYSASVLLYFTILLQCLMVPKEFIKSYKLLSLFAMSATFTTLFRNNGIYLIAITVLFILPYLIKQFWKQKQSVIKAVTVFVLPLVLYVVINQQLVSHYHIESGSKAEMLSVPFQQTARYLRDYKEEVTEKEKEAIAAILNYEKLGKLYNPRISDPVKATFKKDATNEELKAYFKVWFQQFKKHPVLYAEATMNSIYSLFCPNIDNVKYYVGSELIIYEGAPVVLKTPGPLKEVQREIMKIYELIHTLPIIGLLSNIAFYVLVFLYLAVFVIKDKTYIGLLAFIPGAISIAIAVVSPVIMGHPRYMFPVVYTVPTLVCYYWYLHHNKRETKPVS